MNSCCEHLFREAKREIEIRDKRITENQTRIENLIKVNEKLEVENAKLRDCVKFYANEENQIAPIYKHDGRNRPGADFTAPYRMDSGKRAKQCLKEL